MYNQHMSPKLKNVALGLGLSAIMTGAAGCGLFSSNSSASALATVNGHAITQTTLNNFVAMTELFNGSTLPNTAKEKYLEVQGLAQQTAVNDWALAHHLITVKSATAQANNIISAQLESQVGGAKGLASLLKTKHLTMTVLTNYLTQQMISQSAYQYATKGVKKPTLAAEQAYYQKNASQFKSPPEAEVSDIVVKTQAEATTVVGLLNKGTAFSTLAKKYSILPSEVKSGGNLGWLAETTTGTMSPAMYQTLQGMKPGQFTTYQGSQGFHVIRLVAVKPGSLSKFSAVQSQVSSDVLQQNQFNVYKTWANHVEKTEHTHINIKS